MPFERLVALTISDEQGYQSYRDGMTPLLNAAGADFRFDFIVSKVLKTAGDTEINRVFLIRFPNRATRERFFSDPAYLAIRTRYYGPSVKTATVIAEYEVSETGDARGTAVAFLALIASGQVDEAYEKYIDMTGVHHNAHFPAGFSELREAMKESQVTFPNKVLTIKRVLAEGDIVAVHSHVVLTPGELELATLHMFRFNAGKIVEMWDIAQQIDFDSPNKAGMF